ncbi:hypothetical protein BLA6993_04920 [Burkholderia lata]|uniref:DUF3088 domain-containing protein n=1 Tax=Burkholderia lata (strain ATCC 17760 / DSM 23089 / LMG 22485 / NCIMB 9086 / R18194 / 383) TaxID=482957 RepID=UPI001452EEE7|nr:DUF3088 domain-containing protein [Burkholderia lata]VWC02470.1 hypothetical protein BLA6993_04920 [Burkholderia lata]
MKDTLFILRPGFFKDSECPFYCGDSVAVEGLLSFYPQLRDAVYVEYIDAPRPRQPIVTLIGADNQSAPVLVLADGRAPDDDTLAIREHNGRRFIDSPADIRRYLSAQYGVAHVA